MAKVTGVRVFYSWQSDSPEKTNRYGIRDACKKAVKAIEASRADVEILLDEATRGTAGSPNIAHTILDKIDTSDIFIADVTTVTPTGAERPCPNPNIGFELGYAVAQLGWSRVILLFNKRHGTFPGDLPFDFAQNRISTYNWDIPDPRPPQLVQLLECAMTAIVTMNPKRPAELRGLPKEKIEHDADVENMKWLMSTLHLPSIDQHIVMLPSRIGFETLWFYENFAAVVEASSFGLHDNTLRKAVTDLHANWRDILPRHSHHYSPAGGSNVLVFQDPSASSETRAAWKAIERSRVKMRKALALLTNRLRTGYVEVSIRKANAHAKHDYEKNYPANE